MTHPTPPLYDPLYPSPPMYDPLHPIGFQKFMSGYKGMCVSGQKFLKLWQVTDKIIEWIFMQFTFNILWVTLTQKKKLVRCQKFTNGFEGMCMSGGKFLKSWQVTDKIIEWIFMQFTFTILWVTLTQKIITDRVSKIHKWSWGDVYEWGKVS